MDTDSRAPKRLCESSSNPAPAAAPPDDVYLDLSSDIRGILAALQQVRRKAQQDGQKKNEEIIQSIAAEIKSSHDGTKQKIEKEWQNLVKAGTKLCKEYEAALQNEFAKYQSVRERFAKEKASCMQVYEDIFTKFGDEKEKLSARFELQRKKDKAALADLQKSCTDKISASECLLKKNKQEEKSFSILRKSLGSFLESDSDDDLDD